MPNPRKPRKHRCAVMPCNASILPYDPHGFPSYPHQDALSKRHPVAMDDCAQRIDSPSTKFSPPVLILKAIYLRTGIQFQFQFPSKIFAYGIKCLMHLPFICSDKKNIVGKAQILHARKCRREMVELLQVKIEKPWAGIVSEDKATQFLVCRISRSVVEKLVRYPQPLFVFYDPPHLPGQYRYFDRSVSMVDVCFGNKNFRASLHPFPKLANGCVWPILPDELSAVFPFFDGRRQTSINLLIQPVQQNRLERLDDHVMQNLFRAKHWLLDFSWLMVRTIDNLMRVVLAWTVIGILGARNNMVIRFVELAKCAHDFSAAKFSLRCIQRTFRYRFRQQH